MIPLSLVIVLMAVIMTAAPVSASDAYVEGPIVLGTGETASFHLYSPEAVTYSASFPDGSVDVPYGIVDGDAEINVTMPSTPGRHWLTVRFTQDDGTVSVNKWYIDVYEGYTFTATIRNGGNMSVNGMPVSFILDGQLINSTTVDMAAGEEITVEYRHVIPPLSGGRHTITVLIESEDGVVLSPSGSTRMNTVFYIGQSDSSLANWLLGITLVVISIALVWVYRKPKRNLGRPRGRRRH